MNLLKCYSHISDDVKIKNSVDYVFNGYSEYKLLFGELMNTFQIIICKCGLKCRAICWKLITTDWQLNTLANNWLWRIAFLLPLTRWNKTVIIYEPWNRGEKGIYDFMFPYFIFWGYMRMYASNKQVSVRTAMLSLKGEVGKKVFPAIRSSKRNNLSTLSAQEARKKIEAARKR